MWCSWPDLNRHGRLIPTDFKSVVSANSTTRANSELPYNDSKIKKLCQAFAGIFFARFFLADLLLVVLFSAALLRDSREPELAGP